MGFMQVNCQGLPCPQPIMRLAELLKKEQIADLEVLVDNLAAVENVTRFLTRHGYTCQTSGNAPLWTIKAKNTGDVKIASLDSDANAVACTILGSGETLRTLIFIPTNEIGSGDAELGSKLMKNFLLTLPEISPWRIVLVNAGVKLAVKNSPVLEELQKLEKAGTSILVCGTCLEFFGLTAEKAVGETTNMLDIVTSMQLAQKVIRV